METMKAEELNRAILSHDATVGRPIRYYDESGAFYDLSTDTLIGKNLNNYQGWYCGAGSLNLHINYDGNIYGATCGVGGHFGNAYSEFKVPQGWIKCTAERCTCGADLFVPKFRHKEHADLLRKTNAQQTQLEKKQIGPLSNICASERVHMSSNKQVYWEIGRRCNYSCSYCVPWIHSKTDPHRSLDELMTATHKIEEAFMKGSRVNFIISGGEPTASPAFMEWVRYLHKQQHRISVTSNGSRLPKYYEELIHYCDLNISAHFEFWNREKFLKVIEAITTEKRKHNNQGVGHLEVKVMLPPGFRAQAQQLMSDVTAIKDFYLWSAIAVVPVRDLRNGDVLMQGYEPEDFKLFGDHQ